MAWWSLPAKLRGTDRADLLKKAAADRMKLVERQPLLADQPNVNLLIADEPQVQNNAAALWATRGVGVAKESLLPTNAALVGLHPWHDRAHRTLKKYLDSRYHTAIRQAYMLISLEDRQMSPQDTETVRQLNSRYFSRDEWFRRRVYNDCRSGYVHDVVYETAADLESEGKSRHEIRQVINRMFEASITLNPLNIYVNSAMTDADLTVRLNASLRKLGRPIVRVFARGDNWNRAVGTCINFADANGFGWHKQDTPIGRIPSGCMRVWNREFGDTYIPVEAAVEDQLKKGWQEALEK